MTNRLASEKSPYLLQHAFNPVDWHPWGEEAFEKARRENKPIFLSIGYATCHWCHVMERESFESEEVARILNAGFVSIKVDREEKPEVDELYMKAVTHVMGIQGGWPLSVWLTPDLKPFFGGTYFPPEDHHGRPGFKSILNRVTEVWTTRGADIHRDAEAVADAVRRVGAVTAPGEPEPDFFTGALASVEARWDRICGGLGHAPKFPQVSVLSYLMRLHAQEKDPEVRRMFERQLRAMANGGIRDHLGGGFARYSTDERWLVPHFEKMLYDNAQLLRAYAEAFQLTSSDAWAQVARSTAEYMLRDLRHPEGGFYSAEDADSEGEEGKFYVWRAAEVDAILGADAPLFKDVYGVTDAGNWADPHQDTAGLNVLNLPKLPEEVARTRGLEIFGLMNTLEACRSKLLAARAKRVRPLLDDKILTAWNGLAIAAFAVAGRALEDRPLLEAAAAAAGFLHQNLRAEDGSLLRRWREGEAAGQGTLEDYAFLTEGLLELHAATLDPRWLEWARDLQQRTLALFHDKADGGFFLAAAGRRDLIARSKDVDDGALPSALAVAAVNGFRLSMIFDVPEWRRASEETLRAYGGYLKENALGVMTLVSSLPWIHGAAREIVVAGPAGELHALSGKRFLPYAVTLSAQVQGSPLAQGKTAKDGRETVYVCTEGACRAPATDAAGLLQSLGQ